MSKVLIQQAVQTARAGRRAQARDLLLQVIEDDEENEAAWLYLSVLLEDIDDRILALENALYLNPANKKARKRLNKIRLQEAIKAVRENDRERGRLLLLKVVEEDETSELAWLWLSRATKDVANKIIALENALTLNPANKEAQQQRDYFKKLQTDLLALAAFYEKQGDFLQAKRIYQNGMGFHNPVSVQQQAKERMRKLQWHLDSLDTPTNPTRTLIRYVSGSALLYALLVFLQAGLNPRYLSPLLCLAGLGTLMGSLLIVGSRSIPYHPVWTRLLGVHGLQPQARFWFTLLGLMLALIPYILLLIIAYQRLSTYLAG